MSAVTSIELLFESSVRAPDVVSILLPLILTLSVLNTPLHTRSLLNVPVLALQSKSDEAVIEFTVSLVPLNVRLDDDVVLLFELL